MFSNVGRTVDGRAVKDSRTWFVWRAAQPDGLCNVGELIKNGPGSLLFTEPDPS